MLGTSKDVRDKVPHRRGALREERAWTVLASCATRRRVHALSLNNPDEALAAGAKGWVVEVAAVGGEALAALLRGPSRGPVVVITQLAHDALPWVAAGASGGGEIESLEQWLPIALQAAPRGLCVWSARVALCLQGVLVENRDEGRDDVLPTPRERETLALFSRGLSYDDVARVLGVSTNTVRSFVRGVYAKLEVVTKTEAVLAARRRGWLDAT